MRIRVSLPAQTLELFADDGSLRHRYQVSTAAKGAGEKYGSYQTPRGAHLIRAKIGADMPPNTVFVRRRPTGEIWTPQLAAANPARDWMLTRILWLSGCEPGFNRLGTVDTMRRYIYIHGSPDSAEMGKPGSIGCIRMRNHDVIALFDRVPVYTPVVIVEYRVQDGDWTALAADARRVREQVFVSEQKVPVALEWDDHDAVSRHVVAYDGSGIAIGTGRLLPDGHVGRMAVLPPWRGKGVGRALLERLLELARADGQHQLVLHAQVQAAGFYRQLGFVASSEPFDEAGIVHMAMQRSLGKV
jgi:predicted GNAT family N-acyltransferase